MPETVIFSKVQSRQRVAEVKAAVAYARDLNALVRDEAHGGSAAEGPGRMKFNKRVTKNLCETRTLRCTTYLRRTALLVCGSAPVSPIALCCYICTHPDGQWTRVLMQVYRYNHAATEERRQASFAVRRKTRDNVAAHTSRLTRLAAAPRTMVAVLFHGR